MPQQPFDLDAWADNSVNPDQPTPAAPIISDAPSALGAFDPDAWAEENFVAPEPGPTSPVQPQEESSVLGVVKEGARNTPFPMIGLAMELASPKRQDDPFIGGVIRGAQQAGIITGQAGSAAGMTFPGAVLKSGFDDGLQPIRDQYLPPGQKAQAPEAFQPLARAINDTVNNAVDLLRGPVADTLIKMGKENAEVYKGWGEKVEATVPAYRRGKDFIKDPSLLWNPAYMVEGAISAAGSMIPPLLAALAGGPVAAGVVGATMEGAPFLQELMDKGVMPGEALLRSGGYFAVSAALNAFSFGKILDPGVMDAMKVAGAKILTASGIEGLTEWLEGPVQALAEHIGNLSIVKKDSTWTEDMKAGLDKAFKPDEPLSLFEAVAKAGREEAAVIPGAITTGGGISAVSHLMATNPEAPPVVPPQPTAPVPPPPANAPVDILAFAFDMPKPEEEPATPIQQLINQQTGISMEPARPAGYYDQPIIGQDQIQEFEQGLNMQTGPTELLGPDDTLTQEWQARQADQADQDAMNEQTRLATEWQGKQQAPTPVAPPMQGIDLEAGRRNQETEWDAKDKQQKAVAAWQTALDETPEDDEVGRAKAEWSLREAQAGRPVSMPRALPNEDLAAEWQARIDARANQAATSPLNDRPQPTAAQAAAGNYKKGPIRIQGMEISVENPAGSVRKGTDEDGKAWETEMKNHYGYIKGTKGADKAHLDTFVGPNPNAPQVFVVDQINPKTGEFDEHKVMIGFDNANAAKAAYLDNYEPGWKGLGAISGMSVDQFKEWSKKPRLTKKPVVKGAEYSTTPDMPGVTTPQIRAAFPKALVKETADGWEVNHGGTRIRVTKVGEIQIDEAAFEKTYERKRTEDERALGSFAVVKGDAVISLTDGAGDSTLRHEIWHAAERMALTPKDVDVVAKEHGGSEARANAYAEWLGKREAQTPVQKIFQKIFDFFSRIKAVFSKNANDVFREVSTGRAFEKSAKAEEAKNPEYVARSITESAQFKRWFGDSKVVDADGKPRIVYHGTARDVEAFDPERSGRNYPSTGGRKGFFFTSSPVTAEAYAEQAETRTLDGKARVMPIFLSLKNPIIRNTKGYADRYFDRNRDKIYAAAEKAGADGIIVNGEGRSLYVAFKPTQIKSVNNKGEFSSVDSRIMYHSGSEEVAEDRKWATHEPPRTKDGKIKGAPEWVQNDKDLAKMRREMRKFVREGLVGRMWYENSAESVLKMVKGDVALAEKFIQLLAIYSPNSNVWVNSIQAVRAFSHWAKKAARNAFSVGSGDGDGKATSVLYDNSPWSGRKTNSFYLNLMYDLAQKHPSEVAKLDVDGDLINAITQPATIDVWMARAFGYRVEQFGNDKGTGQYSFAENEVRRLTAQLNLERKPGAPRWTPHQVQASVWTAIKTRYEVQDVKDKTNALSQKQGIIHKKLNDKGELAWVYPKNAEDKRRHLANWRHFAMQVTSDQVIAEAEIRARSFGDDLQRMTNVVTWEALPSTAFGYAINKASAEIKRDFTAEARALLMDEHGNDLLALALGVPIAYSANGFGAFEGAVSPNQLAHLLPARKKGQEGFSTEEVRLYTRAIQYIFKQKAVPWFRPENKILESIDAKKKQMFRVINSATGKVVLKGRFETQAEAEEFLKEKGPGFEIRGGDLARATVLQYNKTLESVDLEKILTTLQGYLGAGAGFTRTASNELTIINFRDDRTKLPSVQDEDFLDAVDSFVADHGTDLGITENKRIWTEGEYGKVHDWSQDKEGSEIIAGGGEGSLGGRPDLLPWLRDRRAAFDALIEQYSGEALDARKGDVQYNVTSDGQQLRHRGPQIFGGVDAETVKSSYGEPREGSESVLGYRYGKSVRSTLSGKFNGQGIKGAEAKRLALSSDPRIKSRIYFYVNTGRGVRPEPGLGANIHAVNLHNLYNTTEDPLGLVKTAYADRMKDPAQKANDMESAIIDAGFDGYWNPEAQSNNGVAVLLGDHTAVPVDLVQGAPQYQTSAFYSAVERAIVAVDFKSMPAADLANRIRKIQGIKAEELEDLGLIEWLEGMGKEKVTKDQAVEFVRDGGPKIEEVQKGTSYEADDREAAYNEALEQLSRADAYDDHAVEVMDAWLADPNQDNTLEAEQLFIDAGLEWDATFGGIIGEAESSGSTKFSQYQMPGGENYREVLLTLPDASNRESARKDAIEAELQAMELTPETMGRREELRAEYRDLSDAILERGSYQSNHWNEPNVLAHVRLNDRTGPNGEKILFVEEIQSDWHQEGRKKGYAQDKALLDAQIAALREEKEAFIQAHRKADNYGGKPFPEVIAKLREFDTRIGELVNKMRDAVPSAPFKKSWAMLAFKRVLRMAAEQGYDSVAWTTGEVQAERYDLSKQVKEIRYQRNADGTFDVWASNDEVGGGAISEEVDKQSLKIDEVEAFVGKDIAQKISNGEGRDDDGDMVLSGVDLKVGGEGMKGFYDRILPAEIGKYAKKWGVKVSTTSLPVSGGKPTEYADFNDYMAKKDTGTKEAWTLPITDVMREDIMKGQPLYQAPSKAPSIVDVKEAFSWADSVEEDGDGRAVVTVGKNSFAVTKVEQITPDEVAFKIQYKRAFDPRTDQIAGDYKEGEIRLSKVANKWTLMHEYFHALEDMGVVSKMEQGLLNTAAKKGGYDLAPSENRAYYIQDQLESRSFDRKTPLGRLLQKIADYIDAFANLFTRTTRGVVRDVESGKMMKREAGEQRKFLLPALQAAFHGSPHKGIAKFLLDKIGTGEGHQAFGWGLYFTSKKEIGEFYREKLTSGNDPREYVSEIISALSNEGKTSLQEVRRELSRYKETQFMANDPDMSALVKTALEEYQPKTDTYTDEGLLALRNISKMLPPTPTGQLYKVDIPEDDVMLDWNKPVRQQPSSVWKALRLPDSGNLFADKRVQEDANKDWHTGESLYREISKLLRGDEAASRYLNRLGIKGIKFDSNTLARAALGKGESASNYVVFDDSTIKILETFYQAVEKKDTQYALLSPRVRAATKTKIDYLRMKFQDKFIPLLRVQEKLAEDGWVKTDEADAYRAEELFHGKAGQRLEKFQKNKVGRLLEAIKTAGLTLADVEDYLYAKYAPQRNAYIASINPAMPDGGSGRTNQWAADKLNDFQQQGKTQRLEAVARIVRSINQMQRDIIRNEGLEEDDTIDAWESVNPDYVPLKGGKEETRRTIGTGFNIKGSGTKRAMGRRSPATDILAHMFAQVGDTIIRAEKAKVGRAFLKMVEENSTSDLWRLHDKLPTKRTMVKGVVKNVVDLSFPRKDNVLTVTLDDASIKYVEIFDDDLARVMKNLTPGQHGNVTQAMATFTRFLSMVNTSLNLEFVLTNLERDLMTAMINLSGEQSATVAAKVLKSIPAAMGGIYNNLRGDGTKEWAIWYDRFKDAGGHISFMDLRGVEQIKADIEAMVSNASDGALAKGKKAIQKLLKFIGDLNTTVENAVRLATFRVLIEAGVSESDAASTAKNLTVNFNRKGELGPAMNALYMFFNAGMQGSARILSALGNPRVQKIVAGVTLLAFGLAELNVLMGGDDDDDEKKWDKHASDWTKQTNLIFMLPDGDSLKIKMPYGYNFFVALGYTLSDVRRWGSGKGGKNPAEAATFLLKAAMNAFNPMGDDSFLQMLAPTVLDPFLQIATNENFMGTKIAPTQPPWGPPKPNSQLAFRSVSKPSKAFAEYVNSLTGGDKWNPGAIDISPEWIDHIQDFLTGGLGRMARDVFSLPATLSDPDLAVQRVPFLRHIYQQKNTRIDMERFYDNVQAIGTAKAMFDEAPIGDREGFKTKHPELKLWKPSEGIKNRFSDLRKQMYALEDKGDKAGAKVIEEEMRKKATEFNKKFNEVKRGVGR